jgi:PEGA domain-containing protein
MHHMNCNIATITKLYIVWSTLKNKWCKRARQFEASCFFGIFGGKKVNIKMYAVSRATALLAMVCVTSIFSVGVLSARAQNKVMGEVKFEGTTKIEKDAGVWVDGNYVGYLKELKGNKKIMLLPGEHEVIVRQSGYDDFVKKVVVEPGQVQIVNAVLLKSPRATAPEITSTLKLNIEPKRAAVFLDDKFVGHASEFGGKFRSMLISPGKHRIKVELPGYRTYDTEINLLAGQKTEVKTVLVPGSIEQAGPLIKKPD